MSYPGARRGNFNLTPIYTRIRGRTHSPGHSRPPATSHITATRFDRPQGHYGANPSCSCTSQERKAVEYFFWLPKSLQWFYRTAIGVIANRIGNQSFVIAD